MFRLVCTAIVIGALLAFSAPAASMTPAEAEAGRNQGRMLGTGLGRGFDPQGARQGVEDATGLGQTKTLGGYDQDTRHEVHRTVRGTLKCEVGARSAIGGVVFQVQACSETEAVISACDVPMIRGTICQEEDFSPGRAVHAGGTAFEGDPLEGRHQISLSECEDGFCEFEIRSEWERTFSGGGLDAQAEQFLSRGSLVDDIKDSRESAAYALSRLEARNAADCNVDRLEILSETGEIPLACDPNDPRRIWIYDPNQVDGMCTTVRTLEACNQAFPVETYVCEQEEQECEFERPVVDAGCEYWLEIDTTINILPGFDVAWQRNSTPSDAYHPVGLTGAGNLLAYNTTPGGINRIVEMDQETGTIIRTVRNLGSYSQSLAGDVALETDTNFVHSRYTNYEVSSNIHTGAGSYLQQITASGGLSWQTYLGVNRTVHATFGGLSGSYVGVLSVRHDAQETGIYFTVHYTSTGGLMSNRTIQVSTQGSLEDRSFGVRVVQDPTNHRIIDIYSYIETPGTGGGEGDGEGEGEGEGENGGGGSGHVREYKHHKINVDFGSLIAQGDSNEAEFSSAHPGAGYFYPPIGEFYYRFNYANNQSTLEQRRKSNAAIVYQWTPVPDTINGLSVSWISGVVMDTEGNLYVRHSGGGGRLTKFEPIKEYIFEDRWENNCQMLDGLDPGEWLDDPFEEG
ncbi:hypothetical protein [Thioalkalivibrio thiocyanodenitrificans]|uniref:hypothetical protein n=1 Tax=Thioalkalivibrio thiocyanodenitrificans TaxID=243063 RepID=UPI00036E9C7C|nr:hypothetical protein [Thioalkalivibrio thiocyanodenitrificans]